jgi:hypothetical protein
VEIGDNVGEIRVGQLPDVPSAAHLLADHPGVCDDGFIAHMPRDVQQRGRHAPSTQVGLMAAGAVLPVYGFAALPIAASKFPCGFRFLSVLSLGTASLPRDQKKSNDNHTTCAHADGRQTP